MIDDIAQGMPISECAEKHKITIPALVTYCLINANTIVQKRLRAKELLKYNDNLSLVETNKAINHQLLGLSAELQTRKATLVDVALLGQLVRIKKMLSK